MKFLIFLASNAIVATCLLGAGLLADRFLRWPSVRHLIWVAALLSLLLPPIASVSIHVPQQLFAVVTGGPGAMLDIAHLPADSIPMVESISATSLNESAWPSIAMVLLVIELAGAALIFGLGLLRMRRLSAYLRSTQPGSAVLLQRARQLGSRIGLRKLPRIRVTNDLVTPMVLAMPMPTIVISRPLIEVLARTEVDALLSHELAHVRRGDAWLRLIEMLATAFYWWLPTLYLARRRLRRAEEAACDAIVVNANPAGKRAYAESLLKTIEFTYPVDRSSLVTGATDNQDLKERIIMLMNQSHTRTPKVVLYFSFAFVLLACAVGPTWTPAQEVEPVANAEFGLEEYDRIVESYKSIAAEFDFEEFEQIAVSYEAILANNPEYKAAIEAMKNSPANFQESLDRFGESPESQ